MHDHTALDVHSMAEEIAMLTVRDYVTLNEVSFNMYENSEADLHIKIIIFTLMMLLYLRIYFKMAWILPHALLNFC